MYNILTGVTVWWRELDTGRKAARKTASSRYEIPQKYGGEKI